MDESSESEIEDENDPDYCLSISKKEKKQNTMKLTNFTEACNRIPNNVGDRQLANVATALMKDIATEYPEFENLNPESNANMIIGRDKVRGERKRVCSGLAGTPMKETCAISYDGKQMEQLKKEDFGGKSRNVNVKREVIVITDLENKEYVGEVAVDSSKGKTVAEGVKKKIEAKGMKMSTVRCIGADSTSSNTGFKDGSIQWLEEFSKVTFNWFICACHLLELPLRTLVQVTVGETSGPGSYKSELGQRIQSITHIPKPVAFEKIICEEFPTISGNLELFPSNRK